MRNTDANQSSFILVNEDDENISYIANLVSSIYLRVTKEKINNKLLI